MVKFRFSQTSSSSQEPKGRNCRYQIGIQLSDNLPEVFWDSPYKYSDHDAAHRSAQRHIELLETDASQLHEFMRYLGYWYG